MSRVMMGDIVSIGYSEEGGEVVKIEIRFNRGEDKEFFKWIMEKYHDSKPLRVNFEDEGLPATFS